jgi:hypothetical protein
VAAGPYTDIAVAVPRVTCGLTEDSAFALHLQTSDQVPCDSDSQDTAGLFAAGYFEDKCQRTPDGEFLRVSKHTFLRTTTRVRLRVSCKTAVMARRRRRRRPGGHAAAVGSGGRRAPISADTASHTHTARSLACPLLTLSLARPFSNGPMARPPPSPPRPPPSHMHAGWMVSATKKQTSSTPSQDRPF